MADMSGPGVVVNAGGGKEYVMNMWAYLQQHPESFKATEESVKDLKEVIEFEAQKKEPATLGSQQGNILKGHHCLGGWVSKPCSACKASFKGSSRLCSFCGGTKLIKERCSTCTSNGEVAQHPAYPREVPIRSTSGSSLASVPTSESRQNRIDGDERLARDRRPGSYSRIDSIISNVDKNQVNPFDSQASLLQQHSSNSEIVRNLEKESLDVFQISSRSSQHGIESEGSSSSSGNTRLTSLRSKQRGDHTLGPPESPQVISIRSPSALNSSQLQSSNTSPVIAPPRPVEPSVSQEEVKSSSIESYIEGMIARSSQQHSGDEAAKAQIRSLLQAIRAWTVETGDTSVLQSLSSEINELANRGKWNAANPGGQVSSAYATTAPFLAEQPLSSGAQTFPHAAPRSARGEGGSNECRTRLGAEQITSPNTHRLRCPYYFDGLEKRCQTLHKFPRDVIRHLRVHNFHYCRTCSQHYINKHDLQEHTHTFICIHLDCRNRGEGEVDPHNRIRGCEGNLHSQAMWYALYSRLFRGSSLPPWGRVYIQVDEGGVPLDSETPSGPVDESMYGSSEERERTTLLSPSNHGAGGFSPTISRNLNEARHDPSVERHEAVGWSREIIERVNLLITGGMQQNEVIINQQNTIYELTQGRVQDTARINSLEEQNCGLQEQMRGIQEQLRNLQNQFSQPRL